MDKSTILLRQIHPCIYKRGRILEGAFDPHNHNDISVYDRSQISPEDAFLHYTTVFNLKSAGVGGVSVDECEQASLAVKPAPSRNNPAHCLIDFSAIPMKERRLKIMRLCLLANQRGMLYTP